MITKEYRKQWRETHKSSNALSQKRYRQKIKLEVLGHYSLLKGMTNQDGTTIKIPCCGVCQESDLSKLEIDHIEGSGNKHRKILFSCPNSYQFYLWLRKQGYPSGYQTVCQKHNLRKELVWENE